MRVRFRRLAIALAILMPLAALSTAAVSSVSSAAPAPGHATPARSAHMAAGRQVHAQVASKPFAPTTAQQKARDHAMSVLSHLPKPPIGPHPAQASVKSPPGTQTDPAKASKVLVNPSPQVPASNNFSIFQGSNVPAQCSGCGQATVNEPDTANSGKNILQTSNWNIAFTTNGGAASPTWQYQNPYALQGSFCCDQAAMYVPSRNRFVYEGLTLGTGAQTGFTIGLASGFSPSSWCTYHFSSSAFGGTDGEILDYPKIAYSNQSLYVTWNRYNAAGSAWLGTGLARLPLDALTNCAGFNYLYLNRTDNFTFGLSKGGSAHDTFYWVSNWYTASAGSGTAERIYYWPENSGTYFFQDVAVGAYNFAGGSCASQDGVVTNWCSRLDPRWETASITDAAINQVASQANLAGIPVLEVAITAGPAGSDPFPYVIYESFNLSNLAYLGTTATFNNGFAFAYGGCAPNANGAIGCSASWGGGTGTTHFYPGGIIILQDSVTPAQPWTFSFNVTGAGNASAWGDYQVTQPYQPDNGPFISTEWSVNSSGVVKPHEVVFGRAHDFGYFRHRNG